jgi:hypothetical protein
MYNYIINSVLQRTAPSHQSHSHFELPESVTFVHPFSRIHPQVLTDCELAFHYPNKDRIVSAGVIFNF